MRFYGFDAAELVLPGGMLSMAMDPKMAWALAHPELFPVDVNRASRETLLRVPGLGARSVQRLLDARRVRRLRRADMERLGTAGRKALDFVHLPDHRPGAVALTLASPPERMTPTRLVQHRRRPEDLTCAGKWSLNPTTCQAPFARYRPCSPAAPRPTM